MSDFGFGTSECIYCGYNDYRNNLIKGDKSGWYHPECKKELFDGINSYLKDLRRLFHAKEKAF